jgi:hypothetical protein
MTEQQDLPENQPWDPDSHAWATDVLATAMRIAIPVEDRGSRQALQYVREITDMILRLRCNITPTVLFTDEHLADAKRHLSAIDPPERAH